MSMSSSPNTAAPQPDPELPNQLEKECAIALVVGECSGRPGFGRAEPYHPCMQHCSDHHGGMAVA